MVFELLANCNLIFGILSCNLPRDTIYVDLKVHTLWGIHTYRKDRSTQVIKCSPWGTEVKPFPSLQKKMAKFLRCRQIITIPFANRSYQQRPKVAAARKHNLVTLTRPNGEKLSQAQEDKCRALPEATQWNCLANLKATEVADATSSQVPYTQWIHNPRSPLLHLYLQTLNIPRTVQFAPQGERYVLMNSLYLWTGMKI